MKCTTIPSHWKQISVHTCGTRPPSLDPVWAFQTLKLALSQSISCTDTRAVTARAEVSLSRVLKFSASIPVYHPPCQDMGYVANDLKIKQPPHCTPDFRVLLVVIKHSSLATFYACKKL